MHFLYLSEKGCIECRVLFPRVGFLRDDKVQLILYVANKSNKDITGIVAKVNMCGKVSKF